MNVYRQRMGQDAWTGARLPLPYSQQTTPVNDAAGPVLVVGESGGRKYLAGFYVGQGGVCMVKSVDGGADQWSAPELLPNVDDYHAIRPSETRCTAVADVNGNIHVFWASKDLDDAGQFFTALVHYQVGVGVVGYMLSQIADARLSNPNAIQRLDGSLAVIAPMTMTGSGAESYTYISVFVSTSPTDFTQWYQLAGPGVTGGLLPAPPYIAVALSGAGPAGEGRLELFYSVGPQLWHTWQTLNKGTPGEWSWNSKQFTNNAAFGEQYTMIANSHGLLETYYVGTNMMLYQNKQLPGGESQWAGETALNGDKAIGIGVGLNAFENEAPAVVYVKDDGIGTVCDASARKSWTPGVIAGVMGRGRLSMAMTCDPAHGLVALGW